MSRYSSLRVCQLKYLVIDFHYGTPKIRVDHNTLTDRQLSAKVFHMICSPARCIDLVKGITARRAHLTAEPGSALQPLQKPFFVWEPVPDSCTFSEMGGFLEALKYTDVMSPNLEELEELLQTTLTTQSGEPHVEKMNTHCRALLTLSGGKALAIVVRMGKFGSQVIRQKTSVRVDAYHQPISACKTESARLAWKDKIIDPTGAGNAFMGGYCFGLLKIEHIPDMNVLLERAAVYGSVAASFVVEQVGAPVLTLPQGEEAETWNGELPFDRLSSYKAIKSPLEIRGPDGEERYF